MADVFISYSRTDRPIAERLAAALHAHGISFWMDSHLAGGSTFTEITEEELNRSGKVIVLWSAASTKSDWVKDEAQAGRELGKLIPLSIDGSRPPMGFRQIQTIDMAGWVGGKQKELPTVLLDGLTLEEQAIAGGGATRSLSSSGRHFGFAGIVAVALVFLSVGGFLIYRLGPHEAGAAGSAQSSSAPIRVAVLPFDVLSDSSDLHHFADGLTDEIISTLSTNQVQTVSREDSMTLRGAGRDEALAKVGANLLFDGTVEQNGDDIHVRVHLDSPIDHVTLWSSDFRRPAKDAVLLQTEIAARAGGLIQLALYAKAPNAPQIDSQTLTTSLALDDDLRYNGNGGAATADQAVQLGRQLVARAPKFAWGHSSLANALEWSSLGASPSDADQLTREAKSQAQQALKLDPKDGMAYFALSAPLLTKNDLVGFEAVVLKGLAADAHPPIFVGGLNGREAGLLHSVGRLSDALTYWRRSVALDPLSAWEHAGLASTLDALGDGAEARSEIEKALAFWPSDSGLRREQFSNLLFNGTPKEALALLEDSAARPPGVTEGAVAAYRAFITARGTPSAQAEASALSAIGAAHKAGLIESTFAAKMYAQLGDIDAAFAVGTEVTSGWMFGPAAAKVRADPRFMPFAKKLGLVGYWQTTGKWPDFCTAANAPYDCRVEAQMH